MLLFIPTKATIKRKQISLKEEKNYKGKMKETQKQHRAGICVEDEQKLNRTLQIFK